MENLIPNNTEIKQMEIELYDVLDVGVAVTSSNGVTSHVVEINSDGVVLENGSRLSTDSLFVDEDSTIRSE
jgi:hypothetical protein